jgi:hypothetical protein
MSSPADSIRQRIKENQKFTRQEIESAMSVTDDLSLWSAVYNILRQPSNPVEPRVETNAMYAYILQYLLRCIRENPPSGKIHSGYEAAWELAAYIKLWGKHLPHSDGILKLAEHEISQTYIAGNADIRDRLINGTLEHALESNQVRPYFAHWATRPNLSDAWRLAMEWAASNGPVAD